MSQEDGMDILLGGAPAAKFPTIGTIIKGKVLAQQKRQSTDMDTGDPQVWSNGDPVWELVFTLQTADRDVDNPDDDGTRRLFARGQMLKAIGIALRKAHWSKPLKGGELAVQYQSDGPQTRRGFNPPKIYVARFTPPDEADEMEALAGPDQADAAAAAYHDPDTEPF